MEQGKLWRKKQRSGRSFEEDLIQDPYAKHDFISSERKFSTAQLARLTIRPSSSCVNTTLRMYLMDADKMYRKTARRKLYKNATNYNEQILETTLTKQQMSGHLPLISKII